MNQAIKSIFLATAIGAGASAWAATTFDHTAVATVDSTACAALNGVDTVRIALSKDNGGAYNCNSANVGLAAANSKGRGMVYSTHSAGGNAIVATPQQARFSSLTAAKTAAGTAADTALTNAGT